MTIKLLIKNKIFVIALILNASFLISSETVSVDEPQKNIFEEFLEFRKLDCEVKSPYLSLSQEIKKIFPLAGGSMQDSILCYLLECRFNKCCQHEKEPLEQKIRSQCSMVAEMRRANENSGTRNVKKKQLLGNYPESREIADAYVRYYCMFRDFSEKEIINSSADFVSLLRFLDKKVRQVDEHHGKKSSCPTCPLELVRFFGFPQGRSFVIDLEKLKVKVLSDMEDAFRKDFLEIDLLQAELFKHFRSSKDRALDLQKKRQEKEQKDILKSRFFPWMLLVRERLEQNKKKLEEESFLKEQEKQLLFEKNVIEPNAKHAQQVESLREQRCKIVMDDSFVKDDNTIKEYSPVAPKTFERSIEQKQASKKAKFERRAYRRAFSKAFEANSNHQELILLKKQNRENLARKELVLLRNPGQEPLLEKKWMHNPYSAVVRKFIN